MREVSTDREIVTLITAAGAKIAEKRTGKRQIRGPFQLILLAVGGIVSHPGAKNALEWSTLFRGGVHGEERKVGPLRYLS
jgi:hypothetical protein